MPEFSNSFSGAKYDRKLTKEELIRAIRFTIAAEFEAVQLYEQLAESIDDKFSKDLLMEVSNDEKVHAGNFIKLLYTLDPEEKGHYMKGFEEADEIKNNIDK